MKRRRQISFNLHEIHANHIPQAIMEARYDSAFMPIFHLTFGVVSVLPSTILVVFHYVIQQTQAYTTESTSMGPGNETSNNTTPPLFT